MRPLVLSLALLCACAHHTYRQEMSSWVGADANELVRKNGPPTRTFRMENGDTLYVYFDQEPGGSVGVSFAGAIPVEGGHCETDFEVSPKGSIVAVTYRGNDCSAD